MPDRDYRVTFVEKLAYYMNRDGKTQMDLMRDLHLSSSTVSSWCTGHRLPRMDKIQLLADYFHIDRSNLIGGDSLEAQQIFYLDKDEKRLLMYYQRLNEYGKKLLRTRGAELIKLGHIKDPSAPVS